MKATRYRKVAPENCPGHEWITLRSVKICANCTLHVDFLTGKPVEITPKEGA